MNQTPTLRLATGSDAGAMLSVIHTAFAARRPVEPPPAALGDTVRDVEAALETGYGICAERDGELVGCLLLDVDSGVATLRRVSVLPGHSGAGVAGMLAHAAQTVAADLGLHTVELLTRREFPELAAWWERQGFTVARETDHGQVLSRPLPVVLDVPSADDMQELGRRLGALLRAGDVVIASGDLGAGKTTLAQGIGEGLQVEGPVISPTFVISRIHPSRSGGPDFVHVDAYRLGDAAELADIDLDASLNHAVTMVEWGSGKAEWLSTQRLEIGIERGQGGDGRVVWLDGVGARWAGALEELRKPR